MIDDYNHAAAAVSGGGVIAYPTEAVWGLGCDPWNQQAVERILEIKRRPVEKGLILVAASKQQVAPLLESLSDQQHQLLVETWPGPVTWLIPDTNKWVPDWVRGQHSSVAVRVSAHPVVQQLCQSWGKPLVSTSANRAGEPAHTTHLAVSTELGEEVDMVVAGKTGEQTSPSRICDLVTGKVLRS
ncbi:L-threonylcarbamoyladenylate synthase [Sansalvadorimonas sp. 2012CJ34-2]|uniref:Threonylcarbamoyl-AMP synthase n=1 Tax=Parendozoicomonas callyspongiae TaxID=2942213 RepID=A0ABT0PAX7_9GAMM|nr:L-threonylcarbamoyladenylate synthase [Sansalvadorimonas sp. 2012CJ34-2]MCL6268533.1 L-threonylcarbamoyladenylate synthase [Sansalvadorimonas sp. 2012CJ34-2]